MKILAIVIIAVLGAIFTPLIGILCINTLFGLDIAYTFTNWLCVVALMWMFGGYTPIKIDLNDKL